MSNTTTKERLIRAASEIFSNKGFRDTTVAEICETADANIAANSGRCAELSGNARLIGFSLTGGNIVDDKGAGALVNKGCLIADCDIDGNEACGVNAYGGGLFLKTGATAQNCLIQNNSALNGGGIFCEKGGLIRNCTIEDNEAESMGGGGVFMQEGGWMAGSIIDGNIATNTFARGGGGVLFYNAGGKVNSSTLSTNSSVNSGGAYSHQSTYVDPGTIGEVSHSILWNNTPTASGDWDAGNNERVDPSTATSAPGANLTVSSYSSNPSRTTDYFYDLNSNLRRRQFPNSVMESRIYDALNRLSSQTNSSLYMAHSVGYQYDAVGNMREMSDSLTGAHTIPQTTTYSWTYDDSYRLKSENVVPDTGASRKSEFDWDGAGNRTAKRTYSNNVLSQTIDYKPASKLNQMTGWTCGETNAVYIYDANGCRERFYVHTAAGTETTEYAYDEDSRLIEVTLRDTEQPKMYTFGYDYRTRRITRETPTEKTLHVFDGGLTVQEYDISQASQPSVNNLTTESIRTEGYGGGVGGMVYSVRNGQLEASHSNHRGDVIARTDNQGTLSYFARYYAYGTRFNEIGATYDRQRGNTKDEEESLELLWERMRPRDLEHGVFLCADPIGFGDGPNRYLYVHCNPITGFDPLGLAHMYVVPAQEYDKKGQSKLDFTETTLREKAAQLKADDPDNVHIVESSGWKDAKSQIISYQKSGEIVDSLNFYGHGNSKGQFVGAADGNSPDNQLTTKDLKSFYGPDKNGDKINIEKGGHVNYYGCNVATGKDGENFLSQSAKESGRRAEGLAATRKVLGFGPKGHRVWSDRAVAPQGMFGQDVDVGPARKHTKYADPGQPVKDKKDVKTRSQLRKYHNRKI